MTKPCPETLESERDKLWVTDAELIRRLGVPEDKARDAINSLDRNRASGFPPKQQLWGDRRYFPAVLDYFDRLYRTRISNDAARFSGRAPGSLHSAAASSPLQRIARNGAQNNGTT